jgi:nitronate monooxygenase
MGPEIASLELAAAISNAGGLGMISFGGYAPVALKERISKLRSLTSKPFGVNVLLQGPHLPLPESAFVDVCLDERVPVLSFFWGDCSQYVERAHKLGIKVCDQVGSVSAAKRAQRAGWILSSRRAWKPAATLLERSVRWSWFPALQTALRRHLS